MLAQRSALNEYPLHEMRRLKESRLWGSNRIIAQTLGPRLIRKDLVGRSVSGLFSACPW